MQRILLSTALEPHPGLSNQDQSRTRTRTQSEKSVSLNHEKYFSDRVQPIKLALEEQKRVSKYSSTFNLFTNESILEECDCLCSLSQPITPYEGTLFISTNFMSFICSSRNHCSFSIPFYAFKKLEKIKGGPACISITTYQNHRIVFDFGTNRDKLENCCVMIKQRITSHMDQMKIMKNFVLSFSSEKLCEMYSGSNDGPSSSPQFDTPSESNVTESNELLEIKDATLALTGNGLGAEYGYIESSRKAKERAKYRLWAQYFQENGRHITLIKKIHFIRLVRIGVPNILRGEIWEVTSGAIHKRFFSQSYFEELLEVNNGKTSLSTEEIEKDLNRSLPEYPAYQNEYGINSLRRVLYVILKIDQLICRHIHSMIQLLGTAKQ